MKRLTPIELCACILGIVLVIFGLSMTIWPEEMVVPHFTNNALGLSAHTEPEVVTSFGSRLYGIAAILAGGTLVVLSIYRGKQ